jgi:hypothetical protein
MIVDTLGSIVTKLDDHTAGMRTLCVTKGYDYFSYSAAMLDAIKIITDSMKETQDAIKEAQNELR